MTGIGKKIFYANLTVLIGVFLVAPLITFAAFTFAFAIWFLSLVILFKGVDAVRRGLMHWWDGDDRNSPEAILERERAAAHAKREARSHSESSSQSSASNGHTRSPSNRSNSNVSLASTQHGQLQLDRDYEGVGGWLIPRDNNDHDSSAIINNDNNESQISSSNLNRRPDDTPPTFRRRSFGASSSGINSPEVLNTPSLPRHSTSTGFSRQSGSPQSYFNNGAAARSTTSVNSRRNSRVTRAEMWETGSGDDRG